MTIPVTTSKGAFSFVGLPDIHPLQLSQVKIIDDEFVKRALTYPDKYGCTLMRVPDGSTLIGIYPGMDEQAAKQIHESQPPHTTTSLALMPLLMMANRIYLVNPYGNEPEKENYYIFKDGFQASLTQMYFDILKLWQEAEQRRSNKWAVIKH